MIHIQYKNMQLVSTNTDKLSYDTSHLLPIYHNPTEVMYFYKFNINHTHNMFFSFHTLSNLSFSTFAPKVISIN